MKKHCRTLFVLAFLILALPLAAQQRDDYDNFIIKAGDASILFRGRETNKYNFIYNGTYFWYHYGFLKGNISYNGKIYRDVMINVDAYADQVLIRHPNSVVIIALNKRYIEDFTYGERLFRVIHDGSSGIPVGIYEVVYDGGDKVYKKIKKDYIPVDVHLTNGEMIGYDDPNFRTGIYTYFAPKVAYYHVKDGVASRIANVWQLIRRYPSSRKVAKRAVNALNVTPRDNKDRCMRVAMETIEKKEAGNE